MKIALVGNQNSGKTTLFNLLTGQNQKIGNWPGVTIEKKIGYIKGTDHELIDLPGIYSLSPYSQEEIISKQFIFDERPDLIINTVDATNLERSLYLTTQLLELDTKVVIALNMSDILNKKGLKIDVNKLSELLKTKVVLISALKGHGIEELINYIHHSNYIKKEYIRIYDNTTEEAINKIISLIKLPHKRFSAVKILEEDIRFKQYINDEIRVIVYNYKRNENIDIEELIVNYRYSYIEKIKDKALKVEFEKTSPTDIIDKLLLNKWLGLPIFGLIMFIIYYLSVGVIGGATVNFVGRVFENLSLMVTKFLSDVGASDWSISLIVDGIISGIGAVINFVPQLIILFLCIGILEASGYMSRISFLLDRLFRKVGLSGKALIPFIVGSGCSVPGIMSTRTIENSQEREMSILLTPFIPCSAKLPIITLFVGAMFPNHRGIVSFSLYAFAIVVIIIAAIILNKFVYKKNYNTYISELPEYKLPNIKYVARDVYDKTIEFLNRAGTIIFLLSIVNWFLISFNWKLQYGVEINESILASIGNMFAWVFYPILGHWSWESTVAAIQGLFAKEAVVSSMAIINQVSGLVDTTDPTIILTGAGVFSFFTPASAYAFMVFNLFSAPCIASIGAMRREFGSTKKLLKAIIFQTGLAWILAILVFGIGTLIGIVL